MNNCEVCPLVRNQKASDDGVLMQTDKWVAVLDRNQEYLGKSFITLREHKATISDLSSVDWAELHGVMTRLEAALKASFSPDVFNWSCLMNNAIVAGQPTHVHWHLHPRYLKGVVFDGENFPDPKWPRRREKMYHNVSDELLAKISAQVRDNL